MSDVRGAARGARRRCAGRRRTPAAGQRQTPATSAENPASRRVLDARAGLQQPPRASRPARRARRCRAGASRRTYEREVRDIRTCDEQHEPARREQNQERRARVRNDRLLQSLDQYAPIRVLVRELRLQARHDLRQLSLRCRGRYTGPQPPDTGVRVAAAMRRLEVGRRRAPQRRLLKAAARQLRILVVCRRHAHDLVGDAAQLDRRSDHPRIRAVAPRPESVRQHHRTRRPGLILLRPEEPSMCGAQTENVEEGCADRSAIHALRIATAAGDQRRVLVVGCNGLERSRPVPQVQQVRQ
jgi:hypothetical protein